MISQKCPKCRSDRIRRGYRKTSIFLKLVCRYHLLCDACNWEFTGFALPGTVTAKPRRKKSKEVDAVASIQSPSTSELSNEKPMASTSGRKRKVKVRS
jgi:hypothetical protein